jgi:hypothetical protein
MNSDYCPDCSSHPRRQYTILRGAGNTAWTAAVGCAARRGTMYCTFCGRKTHTITNCPSTASGQSNRLHMRCAYCGARDHNIEACPKTWHGSAVRAWHPETVADHFIKDR